MCGVSPRRLYSRAPEAEQKEKRVRQSWQLIAQLAGQTVHPAVPVENASEEEPAEKEFDRLVEDWPPLHNSLQRESEAEELEEQALLHGCLSEEESDRDEEFGDPMEAWIHAQEQAREQPCREAQPVARGLVGLQRTYSCMGCRRSPCSCS